MISLRKDSNGTQSADADGALASLPQSNEGIEPVQSSESWVYPTSPRRDAAEVFRPSPIVPQKKRGHHRADYRELLALEWEAPRLNLCRPNTGARLILEDSPVDERVVRPRENNGAE